MDALQRREPFNQAAEAIFLYAANRYFDGFITAKAVTDIYYLVHRNTHSDPTTRSILSQLFSLFYVLDTTADDCRHALLSDISDYEDAVMSMTAQRTKMDYIVTRNGRDYSKSAVPVISPVDFTELCKHTGMSGTTDID